MSVVMNLAYGVDMTLLSTHLVVVKLAVSVKVMSEHSSRLPPAFTRTRCVSVLLGRSEANSLQYDTFVSAGTANCLTKIYSVCSAFYARAHSLCQSTEIIG